MRSALSSPLPPIPSIPASLTVQAAGVHPLTRAVRSVYRAQHRKPQFERVCVQWIERFARVHPTLPVGRLGAHHIQAFLADLADRGEGLERQAQAREALHFLQTEVLRSF